MNIAQFGILEKELLDGFQREFPLESRPYRVIAERLGCDEDTVLDLEGQVRKILEHCGLPFEEQCLRYYETDRAIRTASSEQVRQPIYKGALGRWRNYEKHLDHWVQELAPIIDELPESVKNAGLE